MRKYHINKFIVLALTAVLSAFMTSPVPAVGEASGVRPDGVEFYRKAKGESDYQKIKVLDAEKGRFDQGKTYEDASVTPGEIYSYKVRTYKRFLGFLWKTDYSSFSEEVEIPACNFAGKYEVKAISAPGAVSEFVVQVTSDEYNGILTLKSLQEEAAPVYSAADEDQTCDEQAVTLSGYSLNNKDWAKIPEAGLEILAGQSCYLKFTFTKGTGLFRGDTGTYSDVYMEEGAEYQGSAGFGSTLFTIHLTEGTAEAFSDYDN
ncbi:MAG: hypothetical protein IJ109_08995 [Firmicutes bacterium]|nr:hypothetical protein [Bacillota bacterium]